MDKANEPVTELEGDQLRLTHGAWSTYTENTESIISLLSNTDHRGITHINSRYQVYSYRMK